MLKPRQVGKPAQGAFLGMLADRAGVEQDDVGVLGPRGAGVTGPAQDSGDQFGVRDIHLAAIGLKVDRRLAF